MRCLGIQMKELRREFRVPRIDFSSNSLSFAFPNTLLCLQISTKYLLPIKCTLFDTSHNNNISGFNVQTRNWWLSSWCVREIRKSAKKIIKHKRMFPFISSCNKRNPNWLTAWTAPYSIPNIQLCASCTNVEMVWSMQLIYYQTSTLRKTCLDCEIYDDPMHKFPQTTFKWSKHLWQGPMLADLYLGRCGGEWEIPFVLQI